MKVIPDVLTNGSHRFSSASENDLEHFVQGFCLAHSHPSCLWSLSIHTHKQVGMITMGMHYAEVASGKGGRIEQIYSVLPTVKYLSFVHT